MYLQTEDVNLVRSVLKAMVDISVNKKGPVGFFSVLICVSCIALQPGCTGTLHMISKLAFGSGLMFLCLLYRLNINLSSIYFEYIHLLIKGLF